MKAEILFESSSIHQEARKARVAALGFEAVDLERLKRMFQVARPGVRGYLMVPAAVGAAFDMLLVNYDALPARFGKDELLRANPRATLVAVSRGDLAGAPAHHIRGMLIASKVLSLLDSLPLAGASPEPTPASPCLQAPIPQTVAAPAPIPGYRALVVDDSVAIQKSLQLNLSTLEQVAAVDFADDGESALAKAQATRYDLIFLDVMMPGLDGYETCARLRKLPGYKKTPIIMVSAKTSPLDEVKGVIAGCTTYLTKPVQPVAFQNLGRRVLGWLANYRADGDARY